MYWHNVFQGASFDEAADYLIDRGLALDERGWWDGGRFMGPEDRAWELAADQLDYERAVR